jgi:hypothetical protein
VDHTQNTTKMKTDDRILILRPKAGELPLTSGLAVDRRLLTGENRIHAILDKNFMFWSLRYDAGNLPPPLRQSFTSFGKCLDFVKNYFDRRNIEVVEVLD